jgi:hypothetical protein
MAHALIYPEIMRGISLRLLSSMIFLYMLIPSPGAGAQQEPSFHWVDFHSDADQSIVTWVERALETEKWTAIREIGVMYDAALVVTTQRANPDALPSADSFQLWSVNLTNHARTPLLKGVNLRWVDWMHVREGSPHELAILYDDCHDCAATTYFTTFRYDFNQHILAPRWLRGGQTVPVWTSAAPEGVNLTQVYAIMSQPDGREFLAAWSHYDYGKQKPAEDYVYSYDVDPFNALDRTQLVSNKEGEALKQRLCSVQPAASGTASTVARGQDSALCRETLHPRAERHPVTTPPPNAQGQSSPPGVRR